MSAIQAAAPSRHQLTAPETRRTAALLVAMAALAGMLFSSTPGLISALGRLAPSAPAAVESVDAAKSEAPDIDTLARYFVPAGPGAYAVSNKNAGISAMVRRDSLVVRTGADATPITLRGTHLGRAGVGTALAATAAPTATDLTASIPRGAATEWFNSRENTLQQGWTVDHRPTGSGPLTLDLAVTGGKARVASPTGLVVDPKRGPALSYNHLIARDALGSKLPAHFVATGAGARIVVDDSKALYPIVIDPDLTSIGFLDPPSTRSNSNFGGALAVEGRWMAVKEIGAPRPGTIAGRGWVDVYFDTTGNGTWGLVAHLEGSEDQAPLPTGLDILVEPAGVTVLDVTNGGRIEVFTFAGNPITEAPNAEYQVSSFSPRVIAGYTTGTPHVVAADGNTLVFGSPRSTGSQSRAPDTAADADTIPDLINETVGAAQVWKRTGGFGTPYAFVTDLHPAGGLDLPREQHDFGQFFGTSVDIDEDSGLIAVGAPGDDGVFTSPGGTLADPALPGTTANDGAVSLFRETAPGTWTRVRRITSDLSPAAAQFGRSLTFAGTNGALLVGADEETVGAATRSGAGYLFDADLATNTWTQVQRITGDNPNTPSNEATGGGLVGNRVASDPSGQRLYLGAPNQTLGGNGFFGAVYAYARAGSTGPATFQARLQSPQPSDQHGGLGQQFGLGLDAGNGTLVVGAPTFGEPNQTLVGRVSTFRYAGATYTPEQEIAPEERAPTGDTYGYSIAQDGDVLAISMPNSQRGSLGFGLGAVAVYERNAGGDWVAEEMIFPYSGVQSAVNGGWGSALAIREYFVGGVRHIDLAVGNPQDENIDVDFNATTPPVTTPGAGSASVWTRAGGAGTAWTAGYKIWAGGGQITAPDTLDDGSDLRLNGQFGTSLAFTGDGTLLVGEPDAEFGDGMIHRFDRNKPSNARFSWKQKIAVPSTVAQGFGSAIGTSGDTVLVRPFDGGGVWRYTDAANPTADGDTAGALVPDGVFPMNLAGKTDILDVAPVAISVVGNRFAVGGELPSGERAVRIYRIVGDVAVREAEFRQPAGSFFGVGLDLSHGGDVPTLVTGASYGGASQPGSAFVYAARLKDSGAGVWSEYGQLANPSVNSSDFDAFGFAFANWPENGGVLVSAPAVDGAATNAGRVYTFSTNEVTPAPGPDAFVDVTLGDPIKVGASQLRTADLTADLLDQQAEQDGSIAAAPIGGIDLQQPSPGSSTAAAPLSSIPLRSIPLRSIPLRSIPLSSIPLRSIDGGWAALLAGTPYANRPLQDVSLEDVYDLEAVQELTLGSIDLAGSPLRSIPLASIALGATPLRSIDIDPDSAGNGIAEWCDALEDAGADTADLGLDCANPGAASNDEVTVLSIGLKGAPLEALPLRSIPLRSIDLSAVPLRSIPLRSIGIANTPLRSIPLRSIDIANTPLRSIPLRSIPLRSIPLRSIDLNAVTLGALPLRSIPLRSIDIADTPLRSIPLRSIDIGETPLRSIPLRSIPLRSIPLRSIDLDAITLGTAPLRSIPLSSIDIGATPLRSIPLRSIDLTGAPLSSIPLRSIPLRSIPLRSIDIASVSVAGTPLRSIPLRSIDIADTPLRSIPLRSIDGGQLDTLVDCSDKNAFDCDAPGATLADAYAAGAIKSGASVGDLDELLAGLRLSDLIGAGDDITADQLRAALGNRDLAGVTEFDDLTLGELEAIWPYLTLGGIQELTAGIRLGDLADHLLEFTRAQLQAALQDNTDTLADLTDFDDLTLGDVEAVWDLLKLGDLGENLKGIRLGDLADAIHNAAGTPYSEDDLRNALESVLGTDAALEDLGDLDDVTLGELGAYGDASLGDLLSALAGDAADSLTLADLLLALLSPRQYPWEALDLDQVVASALDANPTRTPVTVAYRADAPDGLPRTVQVSVQLPHASRLVKASIEGPNTGQPGELEPVIDGDSAVWTFTDVPANTPRTLTFNIEAPLNIGPAEVKAKAYLTEDDFSHRDTASTRVAESFEPNDTVAQATPLADDTITLSHISSAGDIDVYKFDVNRPDTRVSINLSNLDADLDAVLYAPPSGRIVPTGSRNINPTEDEGGNGLPGAEQTGTSTVQPAKGDDLTAPVDLGSLATVQASFNRGKANEQLDTGLLGRTGTYYLAVTGYNGATNVSPYALRLKRTVVDLTPPCPVRSVVEGPAGTALPAALPDGTNSVFVVNRARMTGLYGAESTDAVLGALDAFVTWINQMPLLNTKAAVIDVSADPAVRAAYEQWDASPCLPAGANAVVSEVARVLNGYRTGGATVKNVVLVGGDDVLPFARVTDRTKIANETGYASTFADGPGNALFATFTSGSVQTDDVYVDRDPYAFGDRTLFVPDATISRLVETPEQISDQLADFRAADGTLAVETGLVTGYDFLTDGSNAVADEVEKTYADVDKSLISETWTRADLEEAISRIKPDLLSINAHFDHYRALPGEGNANHDEDDLFTAAAVRGALAGDLARSVVFSMGCHGGLSSSDKLMTENRGDRALDFAEAVSSQGGVFVGNTGFGYGDTEIVALSEQLMAEFASRLNGTMSVGEALLYAKNAYFSGLAEFTPYDEKVLMQTTFYGLPFYRLDVAEPPQTPIPPSVSLVTDPATGLEAVPTSITPDHQKRTAENGTTYFAAVDPVTGEDTVTTVQNRPVQPKVDSVFSRPANRTSHDALVLGMTSIDRPDTDPYIFQPVVGGADERAEVPVDTAFPTRPVQVNPGLDPSGPTFHVAATTGYFRTTSANGHGVQRTYESMDMLTYFTPTNSDDFVAPTFATTAARVEDGVLTVDADVRDDRGAADRVKRVRVLAVGDPRSGATTTWRGADLVRAPGSDTWSGSIPVSGERIEYILQAVDAAGNVGVSSDKASNYVASDEEVDPEDPIENLQVTLAGPLGGEGWYRGAVTVTATGGKALVVEVIGESAPTAYEGPITVTGAGLHKVRFTSSDGQSQEVDVPIDTVGPTASLLSPAINQTVAYADGFAVVFECPDAGSGAASCTATVDGQPVTNGQVVHPAPGNHTVTVTPGPDRAGNPRSGPPVSRVVKVVGTPTVGTITVTKNKDGAVTTLTLPYTGYAGLVYTASVNWGDGTIGNCALAGSGCTITQNANGTGVVTATRTYPVGTTEKTATITVSDLSGQGASASILLNRKTTLTATSAVLQLKLSLGLITLKSGAISGTLKNSANQVMAGETIRFTLPSGFLICTAVTGSNGTATCTNPTFALGTILSGGYTATFEGKHVNRGSTAVAGLVGP